MAYRILVPFAGDGSGTGELSWGQQEMWGAISRRGSSLAIGGVLPLPTGKTLQDIAAELRFIMSRHQSLRTRLAFGADGRPRQVLAASGVIALEVIDAGDADPAELGRAVYDRFHSVEYDYVNEWPVRMAAIQREGILTHLVVMYCHLATDGGGLAALMADLATMDPVTGRSDRPVPGTQPLEQACWEGTAAGRRQSEATLRRWERLLRMVPARRFGDCGSDQGPRFREAICHSPAMYLAIQAIAARNGADTSAVLLAAFAVAMARVTGVNPTVTRVVVSNRFRPGFADTVSTVSHASLSVIDVAGLASFDQAVTRARQSALSVYKNAYYDPVQRDELVARISRERGEEIDITCMFNDRRRPARDQGSGPPPAAEQLRAALPLSTLRWSDQPLDPVSERFSCDVEDAPDMVELRVCADTRYLSAAHMAAFAREMDVVTCQAVLDP
jgi:Condensation domain